MTQAINIDVPKPTGDIKTKRRSDKTYENIRLEGLEYLLADETISTYEISRVFNPMTKQEIRIIGKTLIKKSKKSLKIPIIEISENSIEEYRQSKIPSLVIKINGKYYYAKINHDMDLESTMLIGKKHRCAFKDKVCDRLSALPDEKGGCAKVRDRIKRIENYDCIIIGYQTFNTKSNDVFVVIKCSRYKEAEQMKFTIEAKNNLRKGIADFYYTN